MKTEGLSPKLIAAVATAIVTYLLGQTVLGLPPAAIVAGQGILVALAAFAAPPGAVRPAAPRTVKHPPAGLTLVEILVVLLIVLIVLLLLGVGVGHAATFASYIKGGLWP